MIKIRLIILTASLFLTATAHAQTGMPYFYELMPRPETGYTQDDLREIRARVVSQVEASLRLDQTGNALIPGTPCLTPGQLLRSFQELHPEHAPETVSNLPAFLRSLQLVRARELGISGQAYTSARMLCQQAGTASDGDVVDLEGITRDIRLDEFVWVHPNSNEPIMLGDCTNVVVAPEPEPIPEPEIIIREVERQPDCVEVVFISWVGNEVHGAFFGEERLPHDPCLSANDGFQDITVANPCERNCIWDDNETRLQRAYRRGDRNEVPNPERMVHDFSFRVGDRNGDGQISEEDRIDWTGDGIPDSLNGRYDCSPDRQAVVVRIRMSRSLAEQFYLGVCQGCERRARGRRTGTEFLRTHTVNTEPIGQHHAEVVSDELDDWHLSPNTGNLTAYLEPCKFAGEDCGQDYTW